MLVKRLKSVRFRRFGELDLSFTHRLNVIVGVNGAGKSTILGAIAKMLSWYVRRLVSLSGIGVGGPILESEIKVGAASALVVSVRSELRALNDYVKEFREHCQGEAKE